MIYKHTKKMCTTNSKKIPSDHLRDFCFYLLIKHNLTKTKYILDVALTVARL